MEGVWRKRWHRILESDFVRMVIVPLHVFMCILTPVIIWWMVELWLMK